MGGFEDHMQYGIAFYVGAVLLSGAAVGYLAYTGTVGGDIVGLTVGAAVLGFPFALVGAGFPDIDHDDARPHRYLERALVATTGVTAAYLLFASGVAAELGGRLVESAGVGAGAPEIAVAAAVAVVGGPVVGGVAYVVFNVLKPKHRGVTHTFGAGAVAAAVVGGAMGQAASVLGGFVGLPGSGVFVGGISGAFFFVGFLSHLQCDGLLVGFLPDRTA